MKLSLRHAVRQLTEALETLGIEVVDFTGRAYDSGMVPEVVEVRHDVELLVGHAVVDETVAPTVTWHGQVVNPGQIIVRRAGAAPRESSEERE